MCGGSSGSSGTTKYDWNDSLVQPWQQAISSAQGLAAQPYQQYTGQRIAGLTSDQTDSMNNLRHYINSPGDFLYGQGNDATKSTLAGDYLTGGKQDLNASAGNDYGGMSSPYFNNALSQGADLITQKYKDATEPQLRADAVMNGTLGGGDYNRQQGLAQTALGQSLGQYTSGMQNDQYNRSAGIQAQDLDRGSNAYQAERGRQMTAQQLAQNDQGLTLQRYNSEMGIGDVNRSYNQDLDTQGYQDFLNQQQHPYQMQDWLTGILSRAQGGVSPNMTTTQPSYGASPYSQILGAGLLGYQALK